MLSAVQNTENAYNGDGVAVEFTTDFVVFRQEDISVTVDGDDYTDFTVTDLGVMAGATVTLDAAPAVGVGNVVISLSPEPTRDTDYQNTGDLLASLLNRDIDRLWQFLQVKEKLVVKEIDGTSYAVEDADYGKVLRFTSDADVSLTIGLDLAIASPGFNFVVVQAGEGQLTFGGDATLRNFDDHTKTAGQDATVGFLCDALGEFVFSGKTS